MLATFPGLRDASLPKPPPQQIEGRRINQRHLLNALKRKYRVESVEEVFRCAYAAFHGPEAAKHEAAANRIACDLFAYELTGELPHSVLYQVKYLHRR